MTKTNTIGHTPSLYFLRHPAWWAVVNLLITLYGILFKGWSLQPIVYIFWLEVIFSVVAALLRVAGALDDRPFWELFGQRLVFLFFGSIMGIAFILLTVTFTIKVFDGGFHTESFAGIQNQVFLLAANYLAALLVNYFLNGRFRHAHPASALMATFVYLLILLCFLMVITMHLLPKFPQLDQAMWVGLTVVMVKFGVDMLFSSLKSMMSVSH